MDSKFKRLLSLLLAVVMVIGMFPVGHANAGVYTDGNLVESDGNVIDVRLEVGETKVFTDDSGGYALATESTDGDIADLTLDVETTTNVETGNAVTALSAVTNGKYVIYTYLGAYVTNAAQDSYIDLSSTATAANVWNVEVADASAQTYYITDGAGNYLYVGSGKAGVTGTETAVKLVYGTSNDDPNQSGFFIQDANGGYNLNNSGGTDNAYGKSGAVGSWSRWQLKPCKVTTSSTTTITFRGVGVGQTSAQVGNMTYNVTVITATADRFNSEQITGITGVASSEEDGETKPASKAFDGVKNDDGNFWASEPNSNGIKGNEYLIADLGDTYLINQVVYYRRTQPDSGTTYTGRLLDCTIYVSTDKETWTEVATVGRLANAASNTIKFNPVEAKYVKLTATESDHWDSDQYNTVMTCAEFEVFKLVCKNHTSAEAVRENEKAATCTEAGSYDSVVYCSVCFKELSREEVTVAAGHDFSGNAKTCRVCGVENPDYVPVAVDENVDFGEDVAEEVKNEIITAVKGNTAVNNYDPVENRTDVDELSITLTGATVENDVPTKLVFDVTPKLDNAAVSLTEEITFRLPVPASVAQAFAKVYHDDVQMPGLFEVKGEGEAKYVEITSDSFSEYTVEFTSETPEVTYVAKIGETGYATFAEAMTAANAMTGDVVVEIYDKVTLNASLSGSYDSIKFVGMDTDAEIYLDVQGYITATGKKVAFEGLILSKSEGVFITNAGFMNVAFGVYDVTEVTYTNCTFANGAYAASGKVTYNNCTFQKSWEKYGLWAYGDVDVTVNGGVFDNDRGIKMYAEGAAKTTDLTVKGADFSKLTGKPAIVLTYGESVKLEGNTYSSTGVFELDLDGAPNGTAVTSDVAPTCVNDNGACGVLVDGKIYTTVAQAAEVATSGSTVTLLHDSTETVELPAGATLVKNGHEAAGVTVKEPVYVAQIGEQKFKTLAEAVAAAKAGDEIVLLADVTENVTMPAGTILNGNGKTINGTVTASGDLTIAGKTTVTGFSAGYYNHTITIGEGASLKVTGSRMTVSYGNVFNITGSIADAKTADKTTITPSLELVGGISYNGDGGDVQFNVTNAYVILGDSTTKNSGATGKFYTNFTNSIVDYTKTLKTYMPTVSGLAPEFNFNAKDSVVNFASHLELWLDKTNMTLDNTNLTVGGSFANAGKVNVENGSNFIVKAPIMSSHGGNTGTIAVKDASFELVDSNQDWENAGSMTVDGSGKLITNDFKNTGDGEVVLKSVNASVSGKADLEITTEIGNATVKYDETTGKYSVELLPVAKVGNTEYDTIDEAIAAWTNGTTLTLLSDVTLTDVIKLSSTENHVLDLGTYTMTAASGKDAIQIVNNGRSSAGYALDIKADATNPGGITATGKAVIRTAGKSGVKDRPIIRFYNGVFNASYIVYHTGSNGTNCPQFQFHGGEFNGTVYTNRALNQFYGGTFTGSLMMSVDSSAYTLIAGGTFKQMSNLYMSALNSGKFTIGSAKGVYDREVYIDDNGNYVVAKTEPAEGIEADVAKTPTSNDYLAYSKVATEGQLGYTDVYTALEKNKDATVTVYTDELDLTDSSFTGTIVVPEDQALTITNAPDTLVVKDEDGNVLKPDANGTYTAPKGNDFTGYTGADGIWGEVWGNARESFVIKVLDANGKVMGTTSLNNVGGIIDGDLSVTWNLKLDAASNTDEYWTMEWTTAPSIDNQPAKVELWVDGVKVSGGDVVLNGPDDLNKIYAANVDADGKILGYLTKLSGATGNVYVLRDVTESIASFNDVNLMGSNVTITNTNTDWVNMVNVNIESGVTVDIPNAYYTDAGVNEIEGVLKAGTLYNANDSKITVQNGGQIITTGMIVNRYHSNAASGIYVYGDGNNSTVEVSCADTIGTYSGTFYAKDAVVEGNMLWIDYKKNSNEESDSYSQSKPVFENSVLNVASELRLYKDATLTLTGTSVTAGKVQIRENAEPVVTMDSTSSIKADSVENLPGASLNAVLGDDGTVSFKRILKGTGTEADPFLINDLEDLKAFRDAVNTYTQDGSNQFKGKYVKLTADIDLAGINWTPIGTNSVGDHAAFLGTFDGDGHTISNLYVNADGGYLGLFARVGSYAEDVTPTIKNLKLHNVDVSSNTTINHNGSYVGGLVANAGGNSVITDVTVTGDVKVVGYGYVGGVVGHGYPDLTNVTVNANDGSYVKAYYWCAGGIIGYAGEGGTPIVNCSVSNLDVWGCYGAAAAVAGLLQDGNKLENVSASNVEVTSNSDYCMGYIAGNGEASTMTEVTVSNVTATANGQAITATDAVAYVDKAVYFSLQSAVNAIAQNGGTIILNRDVTEELQIPAPVSTLSTESGKSEIVIDLNGKTLNGCFKPFQGYLTVKNGSIDNDNGSYSAIEINAGELVLENVNITSVRHGVRIDGAVIATINGGEYKVDATSGTRHAVNVSGAADVTILGGTFVGPRGTTMDSGAAVNVQTGATVTIKGGKFSGGKNNTLSVDGTLKISGGNFDQNPSAYVVKGKCAAKNADGTYEVIDGIFMIGEDAYATFEDALNAVKNGETITVVDGSTGDEKSKEIEFTKDIEFTITGKAPNYALPVVTFQNATVNIKGAEILIPELDARQNATINVIDSIVHDAGGNSIAKSYYNGAINISGTSVVHMMQVTTMGYITISDTAQLNATWQTNVYGNGMIVVKDNAVLATGGLNLIAKDYSGRDNTDADRVGKPATIIVDGATLKAGDVKADNGADYSYNADSYGINVGTIAGKAALLDIKNGADVSLRMSGGKTVNFGADATVKVDASTLKVITRGEGNVTLANNGTVLVSGESDIAANVTGTGWMYMNGVTLDADTMLYGAKVGFINGTNTIDGSTVANGWFSVGIGQNDAATAAAAFAEANGITLGDVTVNVSGDAVIGGNGAAYSGWVGSAYSADKTLHKYELNVENSLATFGYLHISKDGELNVKGHAANKYTYDNANVDFYAGDFIINGVATLDGTDAWVKYTKISVDHVGGELNIVNGTNYEASRHNGSNTGDCLNFWQAGTLNVNGSAIEIDNGAAIAADATVNVENASVIAKGAFANNGTIKVSGTSDIAANVTGSGWVYMDGVTLDADTKLYGAKVGFINGTNTIVGSVIKDGWFSVGIGQNAAAETAAEFAEANGITLGDVTVKVSGNAIIGSNSDAAYSGWIGSAYSADKTQHKYVLNVEDSLATFGYLHISKDGKLNVKGHATNKYTSDGANVDFYAGNFIVNGEATLDGTDAWVRWISLSADHADGVVNVINGTKLEASRHIGSNTGYALKFFKAGKFNVDATSKVEIDNEIHMIEGAELNNAGAVTANGAVTGNGTIILTDVNATFEAVKDLSVTTNVDDYKVSYANGVYSLIPKVYVAEIVGGAKFESLAEALAAAQDGNTVNLIWNDGMDPIAMNGSVFGKTVTITGTATVDWSKGFLFVGRGGAGNGTVIFDNAILNSASNNASTGIHVSGREKDTTNKYDGTLIIKNSNIELDYLINRGTIEVDNSTLTVKNGFGIAGRPGTETESGEAATATITIKNGSYVKVLNHNGMGIGVAASVKEGYGILNLIDSTFECDSFLVDDALGDFNVSGKSTVKINALTGKEIDVESGATLKDSKIGGNINMLGDLTIEGGLKLTGGLWASKGGKLSGDTITALYAMFQKAEYEINANLELVYGYLSFDGTFQVNSTIHTTGTNGEVLYIRGDVTLNNGAVLDSDNSVFLDNDNAVLTINAGATVDSNVKITAAGAKLYLDATGMTAGTYANITGTTVNSVNGTIEVINNNKLYAEIENGKIVLKGYVAMIDETGYKTLADAIAAVGAGDVVIELLTDATLDYNARDAYGTADTTSLTINGNGKTLTLNQKDSDWASLGLANANAKLVLNNMTIEKTGYGDTSGAWNTHAIIFSSNVEMTDVTVNNGIAVQNGAALTNVTINEANGYYGLWINGNGQTVTVNGGSINATNGGRGIKIADQYIDDPASVNLTVSGTKFNTAKKAAVLVSSTAGANITASNVDITNVAEDSVNFAWVDEDWAAHYGNVEVTGATKGQESVESFPIVVKDGDKIVSYFKTLDELFDNVSAYAKVSNLTVELLGDVVATKLVKTNSLKTYNFVTNVAGGVTMDLQYADDWNDFRKVNIGENVTVKAKYLVFSTESTIAGTVDCYYPYINGGKVTVAETGVLKYEGGDGLQVKGNGAVLTVNGTVIAPTINVWKGNAQLIVSGENAKIEANWIDIWDGTPTVAIKNGATIDTEAIKVSRGGEITVTDANLTAETIEVGHNGNSAGVLTETGNSTISGEIKMTATSSVVNSDGGLNVTTDIADHKVVFENGQYKVVPKVYVATVTDAAGNVTKFEDMTEAFDAAVAGDTVTILAGDYTMNLNVNKAITVVGETDDQGNNLVNISGKLNITADGATVKNINVNNGGSTAGYINAKDVLVEGCTVVGGNGFRSCYTKGTVTFKDSTITGSTYGIHFDGSADGNIVIDNCVITGWTSFAASIEKVTISDSEFADGNYNVLRFYQDAEVTNTVFTPGMRIDSGNSGVGMDGIDMKFSGCSVADGSDLEACFPGSVIVASDIYVDNVLLKREAKIGNVYYETLAEAFAAAEDNDEVEILAAGTYTLGTSGKNITITGAVDGVVFDNIGEKNMGGANVTFNNVTFDYYPNVNYTGLQHSGNLVYNNCTINGQVFLYGQSETFNNCTFNQNSADAYNVWTYGAKEVAFNECTFNSVGKAVLVYNEGASHFIDLTVTDTDFVASAPVDGKAAIEIDTSLTAGANINVDAATTVTGFGTGNVSGNSLWNNKKWDSTDKNNDITVVVNNETVLAPVTFVAKIGEIGYTTLSDALKAVKAGDTLVLHEDITITENWDNRFTGAKMTVPVTIDGNGHTIKFTGAVADGGNYHAAFRFQADATVKNLTIDMSRATTTNNRLRAISSSANLTVDGCNFIGNPSVTNARAIIFGEGSGANIGNVTVSVTNSTFKDWKRGLSDNENTQNAKSVTVTGNTFTNAGVNISAAEAVTFTDNAIDNAEVVITSYNDYIDSVTVSGNTLLGGATGEVKNAASYDNIQPDFNIVANASVVSGGTTKYFNSLQAAIDAAKNGDVINLLADCDEDVTVVQAPDKVITIDGNGKNMTGTITVNGKSAAYATAGLTIQNVNFEQDTAEQVFINLGVKGNDNTRYTSNVTVMDCTFTGTDKTACGIKTYTGGDKNLTITGCTATGMHSLVQLNNVAGVKIYNVQITDSKNGISLNYSSNVVVEKVEIDVTGYGIRAQADAANEIGSLTVKDSTINAKLPIVVRKNTVAGYQLTLEGTNTLNGSNTDGRQVIFTTGDDGTYETPAVSAVLSGTESLNVFPAYQAKIGNVYYPTLAAAVAAAGDGDTVTMLGDVEINDLIKIEKAITLDLGGKKVTSTVKKAFEIYANATIQNGAIEAANRCVDTRKAVELTLKNVTLTATATTYSNSQPLTIGGSENGTKVNMENVTIEAGTSGYGIITFVKTELTATDSTIGGYSALYVKSGSEGSVFNFVNTDLSGSTAANDVDGNSFTTIALRANDVTVNVDADSSVTAVGNYCAAISLGGVGESVTGAKVTVAGTITGNILAYAPLNDNIVTINAAYESKLMDEGYATSNPKDGMVTVMFMKADAAVTRTDAAGIVRYYKTLADALAACTAGDNTIVLLTDNAEDVTIKQVEGVNIVIDGANHTYSGTITIHGNARFEGAETLTIQNVEFVTNEAGHYFIDSNSTGSVERYAHNVTVKDSTFTATGAGRNSAAAMRIRQGYDISIENVTSANMHSLFQGYGCNGLIVKDVTLNGKNGISVGTSKNVVIDNAAIVATGYGIRADGEGAYDLTVKNADIKADHPIIVRRNTNDGYQLTMEGTNVLSGNAEGYQVIFTAGEDDADYVAPTVTTELIGVDSLNVFPAYQAKIGNTYYPALTAAIEAAGAEDTIVLLADTTAVIDLAKAIKLDVNGKTVAGFNLTSVDAKLTAVEGLNVTTNVADYEVVCENGVYTISHNTMANIIGGLKPVVDSTRVSVTTTLQNVYAHGGLYIELWDGETKLTTTKWNKNYPVNTKELTVSIVLYGNSSSWNTELHEQLTIANLPDTIKLYADGELVDTYTMADHAFQYATDLQKYLDLDEVYKAAAIGTSYYMTLAEAVDAAASGATVKLMADLDENVSVDQALTLDLNGKNYTGTVTLTAVDAALTADAGLTVITNLEGNYRVVYDDVNHVYKVEGFNYVAQIGETKYEKLSEAIAAAKAGNTIVLLDNITEDVTVNKSLTIDGANFQYTGTMTGNAGLTVTVQNVNFVNGGFAKTTKSTTGTYTFKNCTFDGDGAYYYPVKIKGANTVVVEDCTVKDYLYGFLYVYSGTNSVSVKNVTVENCPNYAVYLASGVNSATFENLTVKNSDRGFLINNTANRAFTIKNCKMENVNTAIDYASGTYTITGTVLGNENDFGTAAMSQYAKLILAEENATLTAVENLNVTTTVDNRLVVYKDGAYKLAQPVAEVNGIKYETLSGAISKANAGDTIVLLDNITEDVTVNKSLTIDGAGKNYTGNISVKGSANSTAVTVKNVNFVNGTGYAITTNSVKSITVENCTVTNYGSGFLYANKSTPTVVVKDVTVSGGNYGMHWVYGTSATLENVTMTNVTYGLYIQNYASKTINLKNCNISSIAIWERSGSSGVQTFKFEGENAVSALSASQYAKYVLTAADATLTAPDGSTVTTTVDDSEVLYENGVYFVKELPDVAKIGDQNFKSIQAAIDAAQDGDVITITANHKIGPAVQTESNFKYETVIIVDGKNITIDFAGHTVEVAYGDASQYPGGIASCLEAAVFVYANANLTLTDTTEGAKGGFRMPANDNVEVYSMFYNCGGTLTIKNGTYNLVKGHESASLIYAEDNHNTTVENGVFTVGNAGQYDTTKPWIFNTEHKEETFIQVTGGTYNQNPYMNKFNTKDCEVTIPVTKAIRNNNDGTWTIVDAACYNVNVELGYETLAEAIADVSAGQTIKLVADNAESFELDKSITLDLGGYAYTGTITLTDMTTELTAAADLNVVTDLGKDYKVVYVGGVYKVVSKDYVAEVNGEKFESIQEAVNAANDGDTITVIADHEMVWDGKTVIAPDVYDYASMVVVAGKSVTIDLNGKKLTVDADKMPDGTKLFAAFAADAGGSLTLTGNGSVTATGIAYEGSERNASAYCLLMAYENGTKLTVENGTYYMEAAYDSLIFSGGDECVVINDGNFTLGNVGDGKNGKPWIFNALGSNERNVTVNGGTFNADINHQFWGHEVYVPETLALKDNGDGTWTVVPAVAYTVEKATSAGAYDRKVGYATLAEAIAAAKDGKTVTLLDDTAENVEFAGRTIILDLNSKFMAGTITLKSADAKLTAAEGLTVVTDVEDCMVIYTDGTYKVAKIVARNTETGEIFADLSDALAAAQSGNTVKVVAENVAEELILVPAGVTLDLNGNVVTADNVLGFGNVIDTAAEVGGIAISNDTTKNFVKLQPKNGGYLPIYDTEDTRGGMYKFYKFELFNLGTKDDETTVTFGFQLKFENTEAYKVLVNTKDTSFEVSCDITWDGMREGTSFRYTFSSDLIVQHANGWINRPEKTQALFVYVNGLDSLDAGGKIQATPELNSDTDANFEAPVIEFVKKAN